jgi:hypothetical protein
MHPEMGQSLVPLHSRVVRCPTETLPAFSFHFSFTMLTTIGFQFSMLNIYQSYGCHLQRAEQLCTELLLESLMTIKSALVGRARPQKGGNN